MQKDNTFFLSHILESIERIYTYLGDMSQEQFLNNSLVQDACIRQLEIIGEAVKNISPDIRNRHNELPWQDIAGMRDKLIHHYFGIDYELVWNTINEDLPILKREISLIIKEL